MQGERNYLIDFWKLFFAIMIVICHSAALPTALGRLPIAGLSYLAVEFFFIVSGYLMMNSIRKDVYDNIGESTAKFIIKKIKGFFPYYIFALVISIIVVGISGSLTKDGLLKEFTSYIWDILFLRLAGFRGYSLNSAVGASWYLSAMLLAMFIMYPIAKKWTGLFINVIAPLLFIFCIGWICIKYGRLSYAITWGDGHIAIGLIRAIGEISLGAWCFGICEKIKRISFTLLGTICLSALELLCYVGVILLMFLGMNGYYSFLCLPLYTIAITLSFSEKTIFVKLFKNSWLKNMGTFSLCLYLNHYCWQKLLFNLFLPISFEEELLVYFGLSFASAFICYLLVKGTKAIFAYYGRDLKKKFILE